jgi:hypothetical protein
MNFYLARGFYSTRFSPGLIGISQLNNSLTMFVIFNSVNFHLRIRCRRLLMDKARLSEARAKTAIEGTARA